MNSLLLIPLPAPRFESGTNLFAALQQRRTTRTIRPDPIPLQALADILWAAQGINRQQGPFEMPGRTAGSASNAQEVTLFVLLPEGAYRYDPAAHSLEPVVSCDLRPLAIGAGQAASTSGSGAGRSGAGGNEAPVRLIYVADLEKLRQAPFQEPGLFNEEVQKSYYFVDTGLIAQNVYLAAAALGLAAWFHNCNKPEVTKNLRLRPNQLPLFGQTIGYAGE